MGKIQKCILTYKTNLSENWFNVIRLWAKSSNKKNYTESVRNKFRRDSYSQDLKIITIVGQSGVSSFLVLAFAGNNLGKSDLSKFLVSWSVINLFSVIFQYSLEQFFPKFRATNSIEIHMSGKLNTKALIFEIILTTTTAMLWLGSVVILNIELNANQFISTFVYIAAMGFYIYDRALNFANARYGESLQNATIQLIIVGLVLCAGKTFGVLGFANLFYFASIALITGPCYSNCVKTKSVQSEPGTDSKILGNIAKDFVPLIGIAYTSLVDLTISNGGVLIIRHLESNDDQIIRYIGTVSILSVPLTLLNSLLYPMATHLNTLQCFDESVKRKYLLSQFWKIVFLLSACFAVSLTATPYIFRRLFPSIKPLTSIELTFIWMGLATSLLTNYFRIILISIGKYKKMAQFWSGSLFIYFAFLFLPFTGVIRISLASIVSSLFIILYFSTKNRSNLI